jgi:DNA-binding CsgD family transcriptional regulator
MAFRWPLTGRNEELRIIAEALASDKTQGFVVAGPAGVGKTRLAAEAVAAATAEGWTSRRIACTATGQAVTLGAFARWVDDVSAPPLALVRQVFAALTATARGGRLLLFVDDVHLLDDLSAFVLHQLVLHEMATVVATVRTGEPAPDAVIALWKNGLLQRLELQPLSRNELDSLLRNVLNGSVRSDCTDRMWNLSRGNVLFLHHLVEHERESARLVSVRGEWRLVGEQSASPSLVELVELQMGAVPDELRDVLDLVALAEPVDRALLASLTNSQSIETAEERGLITVASKTGAVCVGHPLYGEVRLSRCSPLRLRRLRGRVAEAMATRETTDPLRLGLLWLESDLPPDPAILGPAADIAATRLDLGLAERLARTAVDADAGPVHLLQLAYILYLLEKGHEAQAILDSLDAPEVSGPGFVDEVVLRAGNLLFPLRNPEQSRVVIDDALRDCADERSSSLKTYRAIIQAMAGEPAATIETMVTVDRGYLDSLGRILGWSAETLALGDIGRARQAETCAAAGYRELDERPQESYDSSGLAEFHTSGLAEFHAFALLAAGHVDEAADVTEEWHRLYGDLPGVGRSMSLAAMGMTALGRGDLNAALRQLHDAVDGFAGYGEVCGLVYRFRILLTEAIARGGDTAAAVASLEATRRCRHPSYVYVESAYLLAQAWVAAVVGRLTDARELSGRAADFAQSHGQLAREVLCLQTAVQFGDVRGASRLIELAGLVDGPRVSLSGRYAHALAGNDGQGLEAVSLDFEAMGDLLAAADAAAQAASCYRLAGRRGIALTVAARAQLLAKNCGGAVSPALASARVALPFTRREHEIAQLVSNGMSNREIAQAMSVSVRTIEGHIYKASSKAGVTSRAELSALVEQFSTVKRAAGNSTSGRQ